MRYHTLRTGQMCLLALPYTYTCHSPWNYRRTAEWGFKMFDIKDFTKIILGLVQFWLICMTATMDTLRGDLQVFLA